MLDELQVENDKYNSIIYIGPWVYINKNRQYSLKVVIHFDYWLPKSRVKVRGILEETLLNVSLSTSTLSKILKFDRSYELSM